MPGPRSGLEKKNIKKMPPKLKTIAILASGNGTNAENLIRHIRAGKVKARVAFIFSDRRQARVLERAKRLGVPFISFEPKEFSSKEEYESKLIEIIKKDKVDVIVLAGYMRLLTDQFVRQFRNRILNIHPSLLPAFKGTQAIHEAYEYGVRVSGVTVHFVAPEVDSGAIIQQKEVPLRDGETLEHFEQRIHEMEYELYPKALNLVLKGKCRIKGRKVIIKRG